ncbi:Protein VAC14-like protein [Cercospora zeina]
MAVAFLKSTAVSSPPPKSPGCPYTDDYEVEIRATSDKQALTQHARRLETVIRNALAEQNHDRIGKIVWQLCHDYAYAVHQPHARNGGLIGLAAAAIALGPVSGGNGTWREGTTDAAQDVARYLKQIVPPVLACFSDQDARVRYYACESMYNIAKVAKGEILIYFNDVFDALSKLAADTELSVKNGAELLDRLIKDIVSESAATYTSVLVSESKESTEDTPDQSVAIPQAFSLPKFIPLLQERINVQNPWARTFLVQWILLLDSIPDLELVSYLPSFLEGLLTFLSDGSLDVHNATREVLRRFPKEIKKIAEVKQEVAESRKSREEHGRKASDSSLVAEDHTSEAAEVEVEPDLDQSRESRENGEMQAIEADTCPYNGEEKTPDDASSFTAADNDNMEGINAEDEWIPGQDVQIDYPKITAILVDFLARSREEEVQLTCLNWIGTFLEICPEDILPFTPSLLQQLLPSLSHDKDHVSTEAKKVNTELMRYIMSLPDDPTRTHGGAVEQPTQATVAVASNMPGVRALRDTGDGKRESLGSRTARRTPDGLGSRTPEVSTPEPPVDESETVSNAHQDLDYEAAVGALTLQFLHEHEATRVAALAWLIMLHRKSPRKILAIQDATFPALLKTLSDPAEAVVTRDLLLLSEISKSSDQSYFTSFMVNLLKLFETDRRLLESRGNLIIRQLCLSLSAERIFRTMADCLEKDEDDVEFASIMVQNLNNNLITAPELADLRRRLRNLDSKEGQSFFTVLFKAWCHNAVATFSLCLLAQAYEQAYNLLLVFSELEMTVNMLIQIDKLVQLLESPVFTYLRMQLLEPDRYPHLYKCLYGLLMLLPQSSAFAALKNRLNSVSAIGYLHIRDRVGPAASGTSSTLSGNFGERNRLKSREDSGGIKWNDLLEKFKATQEKVRRSQQRQLISQHGIDDAAPVKAPPKVIQKPEHLQQSAGRQANAPPAGHQRNKSSLGNLGRFASRNATKNKK